MTITQAADTSAAYAGLRVGPGIALGFYESLAISSGTVISGTIIYTFGGSPWTITFGSGFAQVGTAALSFVQFVSSANPPVIVGVPDGAAVVVVVQYTGPTGTTIDTATFSGYTWDGLTGLQNRLSVSSSAPLGQILAAVRRSYVSP